MMPPLPPAIDLSRGRPAAEFYVCHIRDRKNVEAWRESSAAKNHSIPSSNWCLLTCLRMALLLERRVAPSLTKLFGHAIEHGVYRRKTRAEIEHNGPGWKGALLNEVPVFFNEYGFEATLVQGLNPKDVIRALAEGYYVLPRVGPDIRFPGRKRPSKKTGHFVFLYAYTNSPSGKVTFRINNSAGFHSLNSQIAFPVPETRFTQVFSGDAILVRARHPLP